MDTKDIIMLFSPIATIVAASWILQAQLGAIRESIAGISQRISHLEMQNVKIAEMEGRLRTVELHNAAHAPQGSVGV